MAAKIFELDAMRKRVSAVIGLFDAMSAKPNPLDHTSC